MARDDRRMHGGNTPGLVPGRGHERHEEPVRLDRSQPGAVDSAKGGDRDSALGGHVATRSGTGRTPDDEK